MVSRVSSIPTLKLLCQNDMIEKEDEWEKLSIRGRSFFSLHTRSECFEKSAKKCFIPPYGKFEMFHTLNKAFRKCFVPPIFGKTVSCPHKS